MKKIVFIILALTLIVAAAILIFNRSEKSPTGASLVPESTLLFVNIPDFQACRGQFATTPLYALWQEPEVQAFFAKPLAAAREALGGERDGENAEEQLDALLTLPQGEVFLAVTKFAATPKTQVDLVLGVDLKLRKAQALAYLKLSEHQLAKYNPTAKLEKKSYLGVDYTLQLQNNTPQFCHAFLGAMWVAASNEELLRDVISRYTGNTGADSPALQASSRYTTALQQLPDQHSARAFLNVEQLVTQFGMLLLMASQTSPAIQAIGNIQATTAAVQFNDHGITDSTLITYSKPRQPDATLQRRTLAVAPADSAFYAVQSTDLAGGFTKLMEALARSGNANATKIGGDLDKFLADAGVRLSDDFLAHLGPEVAYVGNWRTGARAPNVAMVVEVKNRAALDAKFGTIVQTLQKLAERTDDLTHAGETLHVIQTGNSYAAPTYALTDKYFVLALTPDYAKEIITQIKTGTGSLAEAADFKAVTPRIPTGGTSFTYCDLRQVIGGIYNLAHATTNTDSVIAWSKLPKTETITRHLGPYVSTTVENDKASTTTSYSQFGKPMTILVALTGGIAAAQPLLAQIPWSSIPGMPTMSSDTSAPPPPSGNQRATSQTPAP